MNRSDTAVGTFQEGYNCSQAVFSAYCEEFGVDVETAYKISSGFGGGMHLGSVCGVVTGAFMVLGLKFGEGKKRPYDKIAEFSELFRGRNESISCGDLLGADIRMDEGKAKAKSEGLFDSVCTKLIKDACEILDEMGV